MSDQPPSGKRYTHLYMPREGFLPDSARLRLRLGTYLYKNTHYDSRPDLVDEMQTELGVPVDGTFRAFYAKAHIRDVLDSITIVYRWMQKRYNYSGDAARWLGESKRFLQEENAGYRLDSAGGVHPLVDAEFEAQRVAAVQVLTGARYKATLEAFEGAHEALERDPPDTKEAVRDVFGAVENLFKLMTNGQASRLVKFEIDKHLPAMLDKHYKDATARAAAGRIVDSLSDWVGATHGYRHEPGTPDPVPPPMDYAIMTISVGTGFLRWLAEIDKAVNP